MMARVDNECSDRDGVASVSVDYYYRLVGSELR